MFETYLVHIQKNAKHIMVYPLINIRCFYCLLNHKKGSHIVLNGIRGIYFMYICCVSCMCYK